MKKFDIFYVIIAIPTLLAIAYRMLIVGETQGEFWTTLWGIALYTVNAWLVADSLHRLLTVPKKTTFEYKQVEK